MIYLSLISIVGLFLLDQWSKYWITTHLALGEVRSFLPHLLSLTHLHNDGAAFSWFQGQQWLFFIVTCLVLGFAGYYLTQKKGQLLWQMGLSAVISGGLGNFSDRLRFGYVIDMIHLDFMNFAIFNLADTYLSIGVVLIAIALWKEEYESHH